MYYDNEFLDCVATISHDIFDLCKQVEFPGLGVSCLVVFTSMFFLSRLFRLSDFMTHNGDVADNSNNYIYKEVK